MVVIYCAFCRKKIPYLHVNLCNYHKTLSVLCFDTKEGGTKMRKTISILFMSILLVFSSTMVSAKGKDTKKQKQNHSFQLVNEGELSSTEKQFVESAKKEQGISQLGSLFVIALGPKPNTGYDLQYMKQEQSSKELNIYVKQLKPERGMMYADMIVYPYIVGYINSPTIKLSVLDFDTKKYLFSEKYTPYEFLDKRMTNDTEKVWSIQLKKPLKKSATKNLNIYVEKLGVKGEKHPIKVIIEHKNRKKLKVVPLKPYVRGETYLLFIENVSGERKVLPFEIIDDSLKGLQYDFSTSLHGWIGDFSDLPLRYDKNEYDLLFGHSEIPVKGEPSKKGLLLSGMNRSVDLFMYAKKKLGKEDGLLPYTTYQMTMEIEFYTNVDPGLIGIGGSPGENVYVKAGASTIEPKGIPVNGELRMNISKGEQGTSGNNAYIIGHIAKDTPSNEDYKLKKVKMTTPVKVTTNSKGELWTFFGTDSGFGGRTTIYYTNVKIDLVKVK